MLIVLLLLLLLLGLGLRGGRPSSCAAGLSMPSGASVLASAVIRRLGGSRIIDAAGFKSGGGDRWSS